MVLLLKYNVFAQETFDALSEEAAELNPVPLSGCVMAHNGANLPVELGRFEKITGDNVRTDRQDVWSRARNRVRGFCHGNTKRRKRRGT